MKAKFYEDMNSILKEGEYLIIGAAVDKEEHIKRYGKGAKDPYALSLSFMLERLVFCLDRLDKNSTIEVLVEERGKKEDHMLLQVIKEKIYCNEKGEYEGWGLKRFP